MKTPLIIFLGAVGLLLAGCATPYPAPADVAHLRLERVDSPTVIVDKIWLERKKGRPLFLVGGVLKRLKVTDTTRTHLDVTLYDATGQVLRRTVEHFEPRQLIRRFNRPGLGTYRVALDPLPTGTARIEVRAHEGATDAH